MDDTNIRIERLRQIMQHEYQGKQRLLAEKLERQPDYISRLFTGKKSLSGDMAREFERLLDKPKYFLDGGIANVSPGPVNQADVPVVSWVTAGNWADVADPYGPGVAERWIPCPKRHGSRAFALVVRGISMENVGGKYSYSDGDIIYVDPDIQSENGSRVIVRLDDDHEATFKQLVIEGSRRYLRALNPAWPEPIIEINGHATICGVVIGKWIDED
jgi:SOS-response transcriptional repressor LexA